MPQITLYQFAGDAGVESASPFCVKVHRVLAYKGLPYEPRAVSSPGEMKRLNPAKKVPVLGYDGELIADSSRIIDFIDERHPEPALWPAAARPRALSRLLEDWADESLYWYAVYQRWAIDSNYEPFARRSFSSMPIPLRWFVPRLIRKQVLRMLDGQGLGRLPAERVLENLEAQLRSLETLLGDSPFLAGDALSGGDIAVFAPLRAMSVFECAPQAAAIIRASAPIVDWLARVDEATSGAHTVPFERS